MAILPDFLLPILLPYLDLLQAWFSERLYQHVLQHCRAHVLVQVWQTCDFTALEQACRGYHHGPGPGAKPTHPVPRLVRALLVKYLFDWSLRRLEFELRTNLLVRWFVGYGLFASTLDHATLDRFEQWVDRHQHRSFFDQVLGQIDQDFPEERQQVQIGDTFAMRAQAAREGLIRLLRHSGQCLLRELEQSSPNGYAQLLASWQPDALLGAQDERPEYYLDEAARQARFETTVRAAVDLGTRVQSWLSQAAAQRCERVAMRLADLDKILADEVRLQPAEAGQAVRVEPLPEKEKGRYRLGSATDPQASFRNHGQDLSLGYNISLTTTPKGFIREIQAATGAEPDQAGVAGLIGAQLQHQGFCPPKLIYDQAAGAGKTRAQVAQVSQGKTQLVARVPPSSTGGKRFGPEDFLLSEDGQQLACPQGRITRSFYPSPNREGRIFYFSAPGCRGCRLWSACRDAKAKPTSERRVFISDYREQIRQARAYNQTAAFQAEMKLRPLVERIIFMLTHYDGARQANGRGQRRADFQAKMCATARNIRTWVKLLEAKNASPRNQNLTIGVDGCS